MEKASFLFDTKTGLMLINKSNYEAFALDYIEGNLSDIEVREMELFLAGQPAIAAELEAMRELVTLTPDESILFEQKELLLKKEKAVVIWMRPRFRQRLATGIAAMLILSAGYFIGFENGNQQNATIAKGDKQEQTDERTTAPELSNENNTLEHLAVEDAITKRDKEKQSTTSSKKGQKQTSGSKTNKTKQPTPTTYERVAPISTTALANNEIEQAKPTATSPVVHPIVENEPSIRTLASIETLERLPNKELFSVESEITQFETVYLNATDGVAVVNKSRKRDKLRGLIGRLPFEDVSIATFVPTYYSNTNNAGE